MTAARRSRPASGRPRTRPWGQASPLDSPRRLRGITRARACRRRASSAIAVSCRRRRPPRAPLPSGRCRRRPRASCTTFSAPGACIAVPVLPGPSTRGNSVHLRRTSGSSRKASAFFQSDLEEQCRAGTFGCRVQVLERAVALAKQHSRSRQPNGLAGRRREPQRAGRKRRTPKVSTAGVGTPVRA
jgi:hypothetical protein